MKKKLFVFVIIIINMFIIVSCSKSLIIKDRKKNETIRAENSLLKKKTIMIERENTVLEIDNIFYKKKISDKNAEIEKIKADCQSLKKKNSEEILLLNRKYDNLYQTNKILKKDSTDKIKKLTILNKEIEDSLSNEIKRLNITIKKNHDKFNSEREVLKKRSSEKEYAFNRRIEKIKNEIAMTKKDHIKLTEEKNLLQNRVDADQVKINRLKSVIENYKKKINKLNNKNIIKIKGTGKSIQNIKDNAPNSEHTETKNKMIENPEHKNSANDLDSKNRVN